MAAIAVIMGGAMGFVSAMAALIMFNASWLLALTLWSVGGAVIALLLVGIAMLPQAAPKSELSREHA